MKLKDLLAESNDEACPGCGSMPGDGVNPDCDDPLGCGHWKGFAAEVEAEDESNPEACPSCGRGPGDGYGADCNDPMGCGYWKDWAREAMAELRHDMKRDGGMDEGVNMFGEFMDKTVELEEQRRQRNARPVVAESYGHSIQRRFQELPQNRIRVVKK